MIDFEKMRNRNINCFGSGWGAFLLLCVDFEIFYEHAWLSATGLAASLRGLVRGMHSCQKITIKTGAAGSDR